ncbi:beta-hydroxyacid dehydrogenase, 3-hydroxyisobutyrate dehydrogenase [Frankia casuarinae]|uniref:6-phosphogluconate dehydrogenase, NAD-binding n=1 Tax=Frankia casuarinae (strain DSM 45818 / CECT 9043 / HFP020203 / CcI3) TaxID=106370 RepID=Q2J7U0_FRACC|nr:NAD(P)-binding domain-containing protein [Frankia casuarinae]ABD12652.1 6-phosphogluconate dehydrogenase, NAD-binding [Frankia casuarinae]EYT91506.1 beta-hydroxyacid dehydrogenase, 3-hydroxyisobutyrate dehydrogenase [Frankia casuarinae]
MSGEGGLSPGTVVGLGPMGRAMAASLLRSGHPVTVWNRTEGRADDLIVRGATLAPTATAAVAASELTILSLTDYQAMYDILDPVAESSRPSAVLAGKVLVNLSSDTPDASRDAAGWAARHGASFVTGGVMVPAPAVGGPGAHVFYSGPRAVFDIHEPTLRLIGEPRYLGEDPGLAQLFYQAHLDVFLTALSSLLHATALVTAAGVPAADFLPGALNTLTDIPTMIGDGWDLARRLEAGEHPGDLSTARMMGATANHIVWTSEKAGIDTQLPKAVKAHYDQAVTAGRGTENWTVLYEMLKGCD